MPGRRRGARTGRGWDAAPPRPRRGTPAGRSGPISGEEVGWVGGGSEDEPLWTPEEEAYTRAPRREREPGRSGSGAHEGDGAGERGATKPPPDPAQVARDICLQQLAVRPRTRSELAAVLRKRGIADQVAAEVLDRYDEVGLIDDAAFAKAWVTSRHHGRGLSRRALAGELNKRGVDRELVGAALEEIDQETEASTARALAERRLRTMSSAPPEAVFRRLVGMLARKGYPPGLAISVVKEALAARDQEAGAFADVVDPDDLPDLVGDQEDPIR